MMTVEEFAGVIIPSIIDTDVTQGNVETFVNQCKEYPFLSIAVDQFYVGYVKDMLEGTNIGLDAAVSYPQGGMTTKVKVYQVQHAIGAGATELNVSMFFRGLKSGDLDSVVEDVKRCVDAADGIKIAFIPQLPVLTNSEKVKACEAILKGNAHIVKIATGFGYTTTIEDVLFLKRTFGDDLVIEAAGGLRPTEYALQILAAGAKVIHTSTPMELLEGLKTVAWDGEEARR
jgi:deoxyribose-phosphate aldolase